MSYIKSIAARVGEKMVSVLPFMAIVAVYVLKFYEFEWSTIEPSYDDAWFTFGRLLSKTTMAVVLASVALFTRKVWPAMVVMLLMDIWIVVNLIYFAANGLFLDLHIVQMAPQLEGAEDSVTPYFDWSIFLYMISTLVLWGVLWRWSKSRWSVELTLRKWWRLAIVAAMVIAGYLGSAWSRCRAYDQEANFYKWLTIRRLPIEAMSPWDHIHPAPVYIEHHSIGLYLLQILIDYDEPAPEITAEDKKMIDSLIRDTNVVASPDKHLLVILVESFETWSMEATDAHGEQVCRNLRRWMSERPVLYAPHVESQILYGRSGDGQLMVVTGLLPIDKGIACSDFGNNVYPSYAHLYPDGTVVAPTRDLWNQDAVTYTYGFRHLVQPPTRDWWNDEIIFENTRRVLSEASMPSCVLSLTVSTHTPFDKVPYTLELTDDLPKQEANYLQTVRYMDEHLGEFLAWADTADCMQGATIVITGDHNQFALDETRGRGYCPLIIYSPSIAEDIYIPKAYQMDVYPTILHAIGQQGYYWQGMGMDLMDTIQSHRMFIPDAYMLSNKLIRNNYFADIEYERNEQ